MINGEITKNTFQKIYEAVKKIPAGHVATYGQIAALAGNPLWARTVGHALHLNPDPAHIPCFRVVNKNGEVSKSFAFGGKNAQIRLLKNEGVEFRNGRVVMSEYLWKLHA